MAFTWQWTCKLAFEWLVKMESILGLFGHNSDLDYKEKVSFAVLQMERETILKPQLDSWRELFMRGYEMRFTKSASEKWANIMWVLNLPWEGWPMQEKKFSWEKGRLRDTW